jgi:glycosyltransferase 2 family protein
VSGLTRGVIAGVLLGCVVGIGLMAYGDIAAMSEVFETFNGGAFVAALGLSFFGYLVRIVKWEAYLRRLDIRLPRWDSALCSFSGMIGSITPAGAGSVLKSFLLREAYGTPVARSAPIVVAERLTDLLALLILSTIGVAGSGYGWPTIVIGTGLVLSIVAVFAWPAAGKFAIGLCARLPVLSKLAPRLEEARHAMQQLVGLRVLSVTLGLSLIAWAGECVGAWLILNGLPGMSPTFEQATFVYAFSTVAGALSMLPGGLIAAEGSMIVLLGITASIQASPEVATAGTLMMRFATLWFGVPLGIMALVLFRRRMGRNDA